MLGLGSVLSGRKLLASVHGVQGEQQPARHAGRVGGGGMLRRGSEDESIALTQHGLERSGLASRRRGWVIVTNVLPWPSEVRAPLQYKLGLESGLGVGIGLGLEMGVGLELGVGSGLGNR